MPEMIKIYIRENPGKATPVERATFYREEIARSQAGLRVERFVEVIYVFIFTEVGELIIQKRSKEKWHNANLLDKSIGGHVQHGDSPNLTAMIETIQELQVPSIVLENHTDFMRTFDILSEYIYTSALLEYITSEYIESKKIIDWKEVIIWNLAHVYFGIYGWPVKNIDREAKWILYYTIDDLTAEITLHPTIFSHDLSDMLVRYGDQMRAFLSKIWH